MKRLITFIYALSLFFLSCEEKTNFALQNSDLDLIVVEGTITNELTNHRIKLSHPHNGPNDTYIPASSAIVSISDGTNEVSLTEQPAGSGEYFTPPFRAFFGVTYTLTIFYQGNQFLAQDSAEPVEALPDFQYSMQLTNQDTLYYLNLSPDGEEPNYVSYQIDWTSTPECLIGAGCKAEIIYYDLKTVDVHEIYKPEKEEVYFPKGSSVIRRKYSVSENYRQFLRSVLSETEWRGGVFDIERANSPTNLSDGAIGYFAVSTVVSDTITIK